MNSDLLSNNSVANDLFKEQQDMIKKKIHMRIHARRGSKAITIIEGLDDDLDIKRIMKAMRKEFKCNGSEQEDKVYGEIIQLQGDQRANATEWLIVQEILTKQEAAERIINHG